MGDKSPKNITKKSTQQKGKKEAAAAKKGK
jgi:hypothetical protein